MPSYEQIPFGLAEFAENPEPRCPCLILADTSRSMLDGGKIRSLNQGLQSFQQSLQSDALASRRVEVATVGFGPVKVISEFTTADDYVAPTLVADGATPMGEAIVHGIDLLNRRKATYKNNGISYYRPWIFLLTDGGPTDDWSEAARLVTEGESAKQFCLFGIGIGDDANMDVLSRVCVRQPLKLDGLKFREMFFWLSSSLSSVSRSQVGQSVPIPSPSGWSEV